MSAMISRSITTFAAATVLLACAACSSKYSDVYSFKKNTFKAPAAKTTDITPPPSDPSIHSPGAQPGPTEGIPGVGPGTPPPPGVPGVDAVPGAAPAPAVPGLETTPPAIPPAPGA